MFLPNRAAVLMARIVPAAACNARKNSGNPEAYVDNGVVWAYGTIVLTNLEAPGVVMLKRDASVQSVDTQNATGPAAGFSLYGAFQATASGETTGIKDLVYG